ncbi:ABC transporter substrate-binding protein [Halomonas sp. SpR8]|uniref:ABC transporter substrate-binding protein n=1 Tax=Halomonas sp. SpR8 TaxID=3050463 RepID=UPI0027E3C8B9|nr:ABC transporter substrate-binding protein [Halomonas sp. SpR8]MDQ7727763.1 ABC transporter substrate-binding protein [Halomonas sp. SpR8]
MTPLYTQKTGIIVKYQNGSFCRFVFHKIIILLTTLLISLLINNISMANDDRSAGLIATFDFAIAETLTAIGHPPRFLAGLEGYETYSRKEGIIPNTTDLGHRHLPNLELLASLPPKYILISPPAHVSLIPQLREIAEVKEYPFYSYSSGNNVQSHWEALEDMTRQLGSLVNDYVASEHYLEQVNNHFENLQAELNNTDSPVLLVRLIDESHARIYGKGSVEGMVLNRFALQNAWQGNLDKWGRATVSATSLFEINATLIFLDSPYDPVGGQEKLITDGQWRYLPNVRQGNYAIISVNYWQWGGFPSALRLAESLVEALESRAPPNTAG